MRTERLSSLCDAFHRYVEENCDASGQLHCDAAVDVNGERHDLTWLIGQLWKCGEPMPEALCMRLGLPRGSSYSKAGHFLNRQQRQESDAETLKEGTSKGISTQERQELIKELKHITRAMRDQ